jgi:thioesterase domain-containing protein
VHAILGSVFHYHRLALYLDAEQPLYGLQARGTDGAAEPLDSIEDMASAYVDAIRGLQPVGPYHLGGYSFGGWVAYEMAQKLVRSGERVALLTMIGTGAPSPAATAMAERLNLLARYMENLRQIVTNAAMADRGAVSAGSSMPSFASALGNASPFVRLFIANNLAGARYVPRAFAGGLDVFVTPDQQMTSPGDATLGWRTLCTEDVRPTMIEGTHLSLFQEPEVQRLAAALTKSLERGRPHD